MAKIFDRTILCDFYGFLKIIVTLRKNATVKGTKCNIFLYIVQSW